MQIENDYQMIIDTGLVHLISYETLKENFVDYNDQTNEETLNLP